jgi:hypothetical protein
MMTSARQTWIDRYQTNSLNLHSLINFKDILQPLILHPSIQSICEIGVENCNLTTWLAKLSNYKTLFYHGVDPNIDSIPPFHGKSKLFKEASLSYLKHDEADHDIFLIDGDHNYYTVYHELLAIFSEKKTKQSICLLHDILPPCGNRDFYYNPSNIPKKFLHPHSFTRALNSNCEVANYGFESCGAFAFALESANPKNGVAEAINDFLIDHKENYDLYYISIPLFYGLGILYSKNRVNTSVQALLSKEKIYQLAANENLFRHIENNRIKLFFELIAHQQMLEASKLAIEKKASLSGLILTFFKEKINTLQKIMQKNYFSVDETRRER